MSAVLVTGGAGYVGSHAVKALAAAGIDVVVYDNLSAGHAEAVARIAHAFPARRVTLVRGDVLDGAMLTQTMRASGVNAVMHFVARLSVGESVREPIGYYRTNVTGTLTVLEAMAAAGVPHFVFSSTAATFGEPIATPIDENHPQKPINPYGESKLAIERFLPHLERAAGIKAVALRYFNAAGADPDGLIGEDHRPEEHLIPLAIAAAHGGKPLTVFGDDYDTPDGSCLRDYVHVTDLAAAHLASLERLSSGGASGSYNLGNGVGMSVKQVIDTVARVGGRPVPHSIGPRRAGDPARLVASNERARRDLGWKPQLGDLDTIVRTAWAWRERMPAGYSD
ncbi:MAG TPA: UDP-glucose 4-epimerase GalE [Vicinamibacterales bacterium]|nr:UDP-glucose 4-epimerase GalE [Vicinamibacterales bacterium]